MSEQTGEKYALVLPCLLHGSIQKTYCDTACAYILRFPHCIRSWLLTQSSLWPKGRAALSSSQAKKESLQQSSQELNDAKTTNVDKDCIWRYFQYSHGLALTVKETAARKTRMCKGPEIQLAHHVRQKWQRPYVELTTPQMTELNNVNSPKTDKPLAYDLAYAFLLLRNIGVRARTLHVLWDFIISSNTVRDCIGLQFLQDPTAKWPPHLDTRSLCSPGATSRSPS